jgi:hypothetical protein
LVVRWREWASTEKRNLVTSHVVAVPVVADEVMVVVVVTLMVMLMVVMMMMIGSLFGAQFSFF